MDKYYSFRIPSPCQEDWHSMSPVEKGRFCTACSKTVIDFTVMNHDEIANFLNQNQGKRVCGHVKKSQLNNVHLKIPAKLIETHRFGNSTFLWALFIVMGTTLFSCKDHVGKKQKIDRIEVVDSLIADKDEVPIMGGIQNQMIIPPPDSFQSSKLIQNDSNKIKIKKVINQNDEVILDGEIIVGEVSIDNSAQELVNIFNVEEPPEFPNTPKNLSKVEKQNHFQSELTKHLETNINQDVQTEMKGILRVYARFNINKTGNIEELQVRSPHSLLEDEVRRVISLLPEFTPAKHKGQNRTIEYVVPITFGNK